MLLLFWGVPEPWEAKKGPKGGEKKNMPPGPGGWRQGRLRHWWLLNSNGTYLKWDMLVLGSKNILPHHHI